MDNDLVKLMYQAPPNLRRSRDLQARYVWERGGRLGAVATNMGGIARTDNITAKLAYAFYWALAKEEYIYLYTLPHWLTRIDRNIENLRPERLFVGRQKYEAYRVWLKTDFANALREILLDPGARCTEFFEKAWVEKVVERHAAGTHNYLDALNKMLTLELVCASLLGPQADF
jgi:asparagine synthase (glutamine-hydrolysing)